MSGVVERLRERSDWRELLGQGTCALMDEAADRIIALEAENARLRETFENACNAADALLGPICASVALPKKRARPPKAGCRHGSNEVRHRSHRHAAHPGGPGGSLVRGAAGG